MKGLLRGIGYFLLYMVFTIAVQIALSIVIVQIAAGTGVTGQTEIEDFVKTESDIKELLKKVGNI